MACCCHLSNAGKEQGKLREIAADLQEENRKFKARAEKAEDMVNKAQGRIDSWVAKCHEAEDANDHNVAQVIVQQERIAAQEREIITLKAKLYDLMMA